MKQSKYSKRRPAHAPAFLPAKVPAAIETMKVKQLPARTNFDKITEYDLGIFVDDDREMADVHLPKAKRWVTLRSFGAISDWLHDGDPFEGVNTVCISFDHYMDRLTGNDCMFLFSEELPECLRVDIGGHSRDASMNTYKRDFWKQETNFGTTFTLNG